MTADSGTSPGRAVSSEDRDFVLRCSRVLLVAAAFTVPLTAVRAVAGFPISDLLALIAAIVSLFTLVAHRPVPVPRVLLVASALAVLATGVNVLRLDDAAADILVGVRLVFVWALWGFVVARVAKTPRHLATLVGAYVAGCALSAGVAVLQFFGVDLRPLFLADSAEATARLIGLNGHPNGQGGALAIALTICIGAIVYGHRRASAAVVATIIAFGLVLSASISALVAAAIGFVLVLLVARRVRVLVAGLAAAAVALALYFSLTAAFPGLVTAIDRIPSATGQTGISTVDIRWRTIEYALSAIARDPFAAVGFADGGGTFNGETAVHNMVLLSWYQGGPLLALSVVVLLIVVVLRAVQRTGEPLVDTLAAASLVAVFFAQTGPSLYDRYAWVPVVLFLIAERASTGRQTTIHEGHRERIPENT